MLLLSWSAAAADLTISLILNERPTVVTFADAQPGPLPSLLVPDPAGEVRLDLRLDAFDLERIAVHYTLTRAGRKAQVLASGDATGGGRDIPMTMQMGGPDSYQLTVWAAPVGGVVETGALAGCQWQRQLGMTDVACPGAQLRHYRVDAEGRQTTLTEIQAGVGRAQGKPGLANITSEPVELDVLGRPTSAHRVVITPVVGQSYVSLTAWTGPDGGDQVRCEAADEPTCVRYFGAFATGLPAELR